VTETRLTIFDSEIRCDETFLTLLRKYKKMTTTANCDGTYDPILLTAVVVATLTPINIEDRKRSLAESNETSKSQITITRRQQRIIRQYLLLFFSRKFEKLMQSINGGLQDHFNHVKLWTKATNGGLAYKSSTTPGISDEDFDATGWQMFFDSNVYAAAIEIEKRYYSMSPDSCVLTLYDGHLRSLQASIDGVSSQEKFEEGALKQLEELGFIISDTDSDDDSKSAADHGLNSSEIDKPEVTEEGENVEVKLVETPEEIPLPQHEQEQKNDTSNGDSNSKTKINNGGAGGGGSGSSNGVKNKNEAERKDRRNRRNRRKCGPPAIKLHIGNLSFQTNPSSLFDYFVKRYGRDSVLECHIPTQRETGKSRGFGFVTMPELAAIRLLQSDDIHEIDGRKVKIAESNTAGGTRGNHHNAGGVNLSNDRCRNCGYSPKYCTCSTPNIHPWFPHPIGNGPSMMGGPPPSHHSDIYGPGSGPGSHGRGIDAQGHINSNGRNKIDDGFDMHKGGRQRSRSRNRGRSYSRSHSPRYRGGSSRGNRSREGRYYDRSYRDRGRDRSYSRSRSRSYSRGRSRRDRRGKESDRDRRDRDSDRNKRDRDSDRDREGRRRSRRSRGLSNRSDWRSSSRYSRSRSTSRSESRSQSYSKSTQSSRRVIGAGPKRDRDAKSSVAAISTKLDSSSSVRNPSPNASPLPHARDIDGGHKKRHGKSRRSRSRSRDRNSRPRKRSKGSRGNKDASKRHASRSRSRSRSRSWKD